MKTVRCAIYTRKSSDEGLEQSFNSLDAQREACAAYILSQASEGWKAGTEIYDDGGLSGGTLERPALKRLLADIAEGRVDIIVVYKVDRLTRSLLDFAKLVEAFDKAGVSFVSITQSFNTTTSMGRLTLNMLLSFAQFEREVTAERIRDKIAASKAKGMWMGGIPPLGYRPDGRTLSIVDEHSALVREIYRRYLAIGNVRKLAEHLKTEGLIAPLRTLANGKVIGGGPLHRGQLYLMLKNRIYIGEVPHKQRSYPGLHRALIDRPTWDAVQTMLADNLQGARTSSRASRPSLLAGKVVDEAGQPLGPVHATEGKVHYRYYVSRALQHGESDTGMRIPAREIEGVVAERLAAMFDDPMTLAENAKLDVVASELGEFEQKAKRVAASLRLRDAALMTELIETVIVRRAAIDITCHSKAIASALGASLSEGAPASTTLTVDIRVTRSGHMMKLVHSDGRAAQLLPDASITKLLARGHRYWRMLKTERLTTSELAAREGVTASYLTRVLRLAFLSQRVVDALLAGERRTGVAIGRLDRLESVPCHWREQEAGLLAL